MRQGYALRSAKLCFKPHPRSFTPTLVREGQLQLVLLPPVAHESRRLLAAPINPLRGPFGPSLLPGFPGYPRCRVGGGALGCPRAGLRPPLKLHVRFSRMQLSRRRIFRGRKRRYQSHQVHKPHTRHTTLGLGSVFHPPFRHRLYRCDQIRRTIHRSSRLKSLRTWAFAVVHAPIPE